MLHAILNSMWYPHTNKWVDLYGLSVGISQFLKNAWECFDKPFLILSQIRIKVVLNVSRSIYIAFNLDDKPFDEVTAIIWNNKIYRLIATSHWFFRRTKIAAFLIEF